MRDLTWDGECLWMIDAKGIISTFDTSGTLVSSISGLLGTGWGFTYADGHFWASDPFRDTIYKLALPTGLEESTKSRLSIANCQLGQNYPNPFSHSTTIRYAIPDMRYGIEESPSQIADRTSHINLSIYATSGRLVKALLDGSKEAGWHSLLWDGRDEGNERVAGGIYLCRLVAGDLVETRSMTLLR